MTRRFLLLCFAVQGGLILPPVHAQQVGLSSPAGQAYRVHYDEAEAATLTPEVIDGALTHLVSRLSEVSLISGPLDTEGLSKALRESLQGWKPSGKLKLRSGAHCQVVDPQDRGGYWAGPDILFADSWSREFALQKQLEIDGHRFALSKPPVAELVYKLAQTVFDEDRDRPFRRSVRLRGNYYLLLKVSVTLDARATADGLNKTVSGVSSGDMQMHSFLETVAWTDSPDAR